MREHAVRTRELSGIQQEIVPMRFRRWHRPEPYADTSRKRAAFHRKQRLEREALPLFADQIASTQHDVDEEMARRAIWWGEFERERRDERAAWWRKGRARLFAMPDGLRARVRTVWRSCPYPADPASFADFLHQIVIGRLDPDNPPWAFRPSLNPRVTRNPQRLDQAFRQIGRKQGSGGTTPPEELLFCGNLGAGILFLSVRLRPIDQARGLCPDHRLHGSHPRRASHWLDVEVTGRCTDIELGLIERLAQAGNTRPVVARRAASWTSRSPGNDEEDDVRNACRPP